MPCGEARGAVFAADDHDRIFQVPQVLEFCQQHEDLADYFGEVQAVDTMLGGCEDACGTKVS